MAVDKKVAAGKLRLILLKGALGNCEVTGGWRYLPLCYGFLRVCFVFGEVGPWVYGRVWLRRSAGACMGRQGGADAALQCHCTLRAGGPLGYPGWFACSPARAFLYPCAGEFDPAKLDETLNHFCSRK